ncbi:tetratricopeptide repeat protein [Spirosoma oryzicola]|uniref:tetratricopeptide repeat protein n=1 Tax=Spirosoma oryzicola TaxID=2898794 RepID=UPI001E2F0173|nr:tetratricopeptide repeat protein [Spirosoma oryzicola]UHG91686.1 tetratricopeptide repeat protein [Spirosoma oryzicola]
MKHFLLLLLFWPILASAQTSKTILTSYQHMLAINRTTQPTFLGSPRRGQSAPANPQNYRFQAMNYLWEGNYEQAVVALENVALLPKGQGFAGEMYLTQLHDYDRALCHLTAYDASTPTFDDMIGNNPVSYLLGLTYRSLGNHAEAISQFSRGIDSLAIKHGSKWVNYRHFVSRAVSYLAINQPQKALDDLEKASQNYSRSALAQYHRGQALKQLGRKEEARTAFQNASFLFKALRVERTANYQEDESNPLYEPEIDQALANLKP